MRRRSNAGVNRGRLSFVGLLAAAIALALCTATAQAGTTTVTNTGDGVGACPSASECTLRKAIETAAAGETIVLPAGAYTLAGNPLSIEKDLTITGAGAGTTTLTNSPANTLIEADNSELNISGITFKNGSSPETSGRGGAIYGEDAVLRIAGCVFLEDVAKHQQAFGSGLFKKEFDEGGRGGAIYNYGRTIVSSSTFESDSSEGGATGTEGNYSGYAGAIYSVGNLTVSSSTFKNDTAGGGSNSGASSFNDGGIGGAIYSEGRLTVTGSTFSGDVAHGGATTSGGTKGGYQGEAGSIFTEGEATTTGSNFSGNTAESGADGLSTHGFGGDAGAIYNNDGSLTLNDSVVTENAAASTHFGGDGGGIYSYGSLTLNQSAVTSNQAPNGFGGGIYNSGGRVNVVQSTISSNQVLNAVESGEGGGIYNGGNLGVLESTISDNQAPGGKGGGIYNNGSALELTQSTLGPSNSSGFGGGIYNNGPLAATNSTIAQNTASEEGGGIYNAETGVLANVTLFGNTAQRTSSGGNLFLDRAELKLHDTLIAGGISPTSDGNCAFNSPNGTILSQGYNAEDSNQCTFSQPSDQVNVSLDLGPLQANGGLTATIALLPGSAAIDKGDPAGCTGTEGELLTTDQRGVVRPQNGRCDVGAFEYVLPVPVPPPAPKPVAPRDSALTVNPMSFAATSGGAAIARANHKRHGRKAPKGAEVSYVDSEAATTTFTIVRLQHGYRVGKGSCKAIKHHRKKPRHASACTREVTLNDSFSHQDAAGRNRFEFTGRLGGKPLDEGTYVLIATPRLGSLTGGRASVTFKIV